MAKFIDVHEKLLSAKAVKVIYKNKTISISLVKKNRNKSLLVKELTNDNYYNIKQLSNNTVGIKKISYDLEHTPLYLV